MQRTEALNKGSNRLVPKRSTMMELPRRREKPIRTQGRKGAWKFSRPKKFIRTLGFLLLQTYTSMIVKAWPKNTRLTKIPNIWSLIKNMTNINWCNFLYRILWQQSIIRHLKVAMNIHFLPSEPLIWRILSSEIPQKETWRQSQLFVLGMNPPPASGSICTWRSKMRKATHKRCFQSHYSKDPFHPSIHPFTQTRIQENHVEQEIEPNWTKKEEVCY